MPNQLDLAAIDRAAIQNALGRYQIEKGVKFNRLAPQIAAGDEAAVAQGMALDPAQTAQVVRSIAALDEMKRADLKNKTQLAARSLFALQQLPEEQRPMAYREWLQAARRRGWEQPNDPFSEEYNPQEVEAAIAEAMTLDQLIKQAEGGPLQEVYAPDSPTGTRLLPRADAAGQPGKPPSGMEITTGPEGTTIRTNVRGKGGDSGLTKKTQGAIEEEVRAAQAGLQRLAQIEQSFRPEFLEAPKKLEAWWTAAKEKGGDFARGIGLDVTPEEKQFLADYTTFKRDAIENLNRYIKEITGAQMSEAEADRIRKGMPDPEEDSPTQFQAKLKSSTRSLRMAAARANFAAKKGLSPEILPLGSMPEIIDNRGTVLEREIRQANPDMPDEQVRAQVTAQLREEFGL